MKNLSRVIIPLVVVAVLLAGTWGLWLWFFCRFYVGPNQMAVVISKHGDQLPEGQILANENQKGIRIAVLGEGRHFLNPYLYDHEIHSVITIAPGQVGIVTSKVGVDLPEGEFLADGKQKGIWHKVLGPGKYRLNPYGYKIDPVDAISIPIGYCGVITSLSGEQAPHGQFAAANQKGVREDILQPGLYYINPKAFKVDVLEIGVNQVSLLGKTGGEVVTKSQLESSNVAMEQLQRKVLSETKQKRMNYMAEQQVQQLAIPGGLNQNEPPIPQQRLQMTNDNSMSMMLAQFVEFPSRDGFQISLDMTVEVELLPENISWIFSHYGDLPAVVDKIIMPQITSISRNKGSEYQAKDFIMGEGREKFQNELTKALATTLEQKKVIVHNALIRHVEVPGQILEPIQQASIAIEQNLTNKEKQNTARKLGALNTELSLIEQRREQVAQETTKLKAEIKADEEKQVAEISATAARTVAEIAKETTKIEADTVRTLGQAQADAITYVEGEKARGAQLKIAALGDPTAYNLMTLAEELNDDVRINIVHSGPGTLWTDLDSTRTGNLGGAIILKEKADSKSNPK
ncbi:MAG: hypothetical protein JXA52_09550 [Planctomycetes bacterium]|nr:hypothetical protein [Planctomycetota bacterium]